MTRCAGQELCVVSYTDPTRGNVLDYADYVAPTRQDHQQLATVDHADGE